MADLFGPVLLLLLNIMLSDLIRVVVSLSTSVLFMASHISCVFICPSLAGIWVVVGNSAMSVCLLECLLSLVRCILLALGLRKLWVILCLTLRTCQTVSHDGYTILY